MTMWVCACHQNFFVSFPVNKKQHVWLQGKSISLLLLPSGVSVSQQQLPDETMLLLLFVFLISF